MNPILFEALKQLVTEHGYDEVLEVLKYVKRQQPNKRNANALMIEVNTLWMSGKSKKEISGIVNRSEARVGQIIKNIEWRRRRGSWDDVKGRLPLVR